MPDYQPLITAKEALGQFLTSELMSERGEAARTADLAAQVATAEALTRIADLLDLLKPFAPFIPAAVGALVQEISLDQEQTGRTFTEELEHLAQVARDAGVLQ